MLDIPSISAIVAAIGVIVGVVLAILELRNITRARQMELIMNTYSLFTRREYIDAMEKIRTREFKDYEGYARALKSGSLDQEKILNPHLSVLLADIYPQCMSGHIC